MKPILVSGLINLETTLRIEQFPLQYNPVNYPFFGVNSTISGVGYNVVKALTTLGNAVRFLSLTGQDLPGALVDDALQRDAIPSREVLYTLRATPQSVIVYETSGKRQIHVDLKDIQESVYPQAAFEQALKACDWAVLCNINYNRPMLQRARALGVKIATDVHTIADLEDAYNRDFMQAADVLFMSDENLPVAPREWAAAVMTRFNPEVLVIGMGERGALLAVRADGQITQHPAVVTRPIVSTIGAGDALFASFLHGYRQTGDAYTALRQALVFASYKIGVAGAADGFVDADTLEKLVREAIK
ncbi:MAG: carbohydrate kinase [Anaerolineales bacterium]